MNDDNPRESLESTRADQDGYSYLAEVGCKNLARLVFIELECLHGHPFIFW